MNDFKEYSAAFHAQNDDVMHYGVKGMKWDPNKKKKLTSDEEEKKSEQRKNASETVTLAGRAGLGPAILKGLYDNLPRKKNVINADSFKKSTTLVSRKASSGIQTASGGGRRVESSSRGRYADSHPDESVADTKKKDRGRYKRGRYKKS